MSKVPTSYFVVQSKLKPIMEAVQKAGVPEKFTLAFLNSLGFKSTNDRPIVAVLKSLGFLNQSGAPSQAYRDYKDPAKAKKVMGERVRATYSDVFLANEQAHTLSAEALKGIFATLSGKSESVATKMAGTFKALCTLSDFSQVNVSSETPDEEVGVEVKPDLALPKAPKVNSGSYEFHYNIQIHLPVTRDISVYNAIFKSLKDHLM
ncbi:MAG: DUF5343 domain-containing protein [Candidatus Gracilibacteria bacterium]